MNNFFGTVISIASNFVLYCYAASVKEKKEFIQLQSKSENLKNLESVVDGLGAGGLCHTFSETGGQRQKCCENNFDFQPTAQENGAGM